MKRKNYKIIGTVASLALILIGLLFHFISSDEILKGWTIPFVASGLAGLIGLFFKDKILGLIFIISLLITTIYLMVI